MEAGDSARAPCVRLVKPLVVTIDQATGKGTGTLYLRNETNKPVELALSAVAAPANSSSYAEFSDDSGAKPIGLYEKEKLEPKKTLQLTVTVAEMWDDGEMDFNLSNHYGTESFGKFHVIRRPVGIKLDGTDKLKLALVDGNVTRILLRNDDAQDYTVNWSLLNGEDICAAQNAPLRAKSSFMLECTPQIPVRWWSPGHYLDLIKSDASRDGYRLVLAPQVPATRPGQTLKVFAGEATLDYYKPGTRKFWAYLVTIVVLILGGISSLFLSYWIPNKLQRLDLKEKLLDLARRTANLSMRIDTRVSVLVRLERQRLTSLLESRWALSPDFTPVAVQVKAGIAKLQAKVEILEKMDAVLSQRDGMDLLPSQRVEIDSELEVARLALSKAEVSDADIDVARKAVDDISQTVSHLDDEGAQTALGVQLGEKVDKTKKRLDGLKKTSETLPTLKQSAPQLVNGLLDTITNVTDPKKIDRGDYSRIDWALAGADILIEYVDLLDKTPAGKVGEVKDRRQGKAPNLLLALQRQSADGLRSASLVLREMKDDVYPEDLLQALDPKAGKADFQYDPHVVYENAPVEFRVRFANTAYDTSAAREELRVKWNFGDNLDAEGLIVTHYFKPIKFRFPPMLRLPGLFAAKIKGGFTGRQKPEIAQLSKKAARDIGRPMLVIATVATPNGTAIPLKECLTVHPSELGQKSERTWAEVLKLAAALLIAVFGMVSGAQDQIQKLDVLPGLVAVFLIGFTADSIKRLLTDQPPQTETSPPSKA